MNYVGTSIDFLISVFSNVISWLFSTEILTYQVGLRTVSVSIGETLIYFFIVGVVISFLLNARFSNIGAVHRENVMNERNAINAVRREYGKNAVINNVRYKENEHLRSHRFNS